MLGVVHAAITWLGDVGSGSEGSPLSVNSQFAELLRLVQVGIFAGVLYLIKGVKQAREVSVETKEASSSTHENILDSIHSVQSEVKEINRRVTKMEGTD